MSEKITQEDGSIIFRTADGREFKSRSGAWKHEQKLEQSIHTPSDPNPPSDVAGETVILPSDASTVEPAASDTQWTSFDMGIDDEATDVIPSPLKMIAQPINPKRKMTAKELKQLQRTEAALLKAGLTGIDTILTKYGQARTLDKSFSVVHSESSKEMVANAQQEWLNEQGIFFTQYLGKGAVAGLLTTWYVGGPLIRIQKEAKKPMFKRGRGLMSRLPLIGRLFRKKYNNEFEVPELPEEVVEVTLDE